MSHNKFPNGLTAIGLILLVGSLPLCIHIIYVETILTWTEGPQMVGYSCIHAHPLFFVFGLLFILFSHVWLTVSGVFFLWKKSKLQSKDRLTIGLTILMLVLIYIPYNWKQYSMMKAFGPGILGQHLFVEAVVKGNVVGARELLEKNMNPNWRSDEIREYPIITAVRHGDVEMVKLLLEKGADPNLKDRDGWYPIEIANRGGYKQIVQLLHKAGSVPLPEILNIQGGSITITADPPGDYKYPN